MMRQAKRIWKYLFGDFAFVENFNASLSYDDYWDKRAKEIPSFSPPFKLILGIIETGSSVLDIGCGDGALLDYLRQEKKAKVMGIEISQKAVDLARAKEIEVIRQDITRDDFNLIEPFDYIIMTDVLEHLSNCEGVMLKLKGKFNKYLLINLPNSGFVVDRLRLLFGRFPKQWLLHPSEHLRFWTVNDFGFWCQQLGFKIERYYGIQVQFYEFLPMLFWKYCPKLFSRNILYLILPE